MTADILEADRGSAGKNALTLMFPACSHASFCCGRAFVIRARGCHAFQFLRGWVFEPLNARDRIV
jgi:hypothetical protein